MSKIIITKQVSGELTAIVQSREDNNPCPPIMEFDSYSSAIKAADENPLCKAFGYVIVDVSI